MPTGAGRFRRPGLRSPERKRGAFMLSGKHILLIIGGGIAAYKSLDLIRRLRERGAKVTPVLTRAGEEFVTPLSVSALTGVKVFRDLFDLGDGCIAHADKSHDAARLVLSRC